jgi:CIC family chloride channel protein
VSVAGARVRHLVDGRQEELRSLARRSGQVVVLAALVGAATGLGVALFERVVVQGALAALARAPLWIVASAPLVGLTVAALALRFVGGRATPATADEYLKAFHDPSSELGWRRFAAKLVASVATLGSGGAMGLEGPSLFMGATFGARLQARLPRVFRDTEHQILMVAGAAAGVAAIFKAPATGAVFALEVPYQDDLARRMLLPALVSAAVAYLTFVAVNGTEPLFPIVGNPAFDFRDLGGAAALGVAAGVAARGFAAMIRWAKRRVSSHHAALRIAAAGAALAALFTVGRMLTGESIVLGPGYGTITWALDDSHAVWLVLAVLVLRCVATASTVAGGGAGGLFIPLVVAGALMGRAVGGSFHALDTSLFVVVGVAAFLGAGYRVPLAAVMFVAETTGHPAFVVPGLLAAVAAELVMGRSSVTAYQVAYDREDRRLTAADGNGAGPRLERSSE